MMNEETIRKHHADLKRVVETPCACKDPFARMECMLMRMKAETVTSILEWVLGESKEIDKAMKDLHEGIVKLDAHKFN